MASLRGKRMVDYTVRVLNGMAQGLFASLIIGLIIKQLGQLSHIGMLEQFGQVAQYLTGPAIGIGVAVAVGSPPLGVICSAVTAAMGAGTIQGTTIAIGEPVGAMLAALVGAEVAKRVQGKTSLDMILVPLATIVAGGLVAHWVSPWMSAAMAALGMFVNSLTTLYPLPMGILVSTVVGMLLTLPISSAAICISLGIGGLAAGAATVGCCCQMVGFAVSSFRENKVSGLLSQGLGTSMLQVPNIVRNWRVWIPPTLASAILGPFATMVFKMENNSVGAGMGSSGLVGQINTVAVMGSGALPAILLLHFVLPASLTLLFSSLMRRRGWIAEGDLSLS
jgi:uncharacterized membrane protein